VRDSDSNSISNLKHAREAVGTQNPLEHAYPEQASVDRHAISSHPSLAKLHQSGKSASRETTLGAWEEIEKAVERVKLKSKEKKKSLMENRPLKVKIKNKTRKGYTETKEECVNQATQAFISSSDIRNRNAILRKETEMVIEIGKLLGVNYGGIEEETMERIMKLQGVEGDLLVGI
ncbi:hypothetical protein U1Q18_008084, partial [Sarracenia purpurea var. burkii]